MTNRKSSGNEREDNIFENLRICFHKYRVMLQALLTSSQDNIIRVLKFIDVPLRNVKHFVEPVGAQKLFHMCVGKFIQTGRTPLANSPRTLPDIKPPEHLILNSPLPSFSRLYTVYRNTTASWMLSAFFLAQLFQEISEETPSTEALIVNMLEELLLNCSAKELMSNLRNSNIQFHHAEEFTNTFVKILNQEVSSNSRQSELEKNRYRQNLRETFEKSTKLDTQVLDNVRELRRRLETSLDGVNKSATFRGLDENIRSQFLSEEKSVLDKNIRTFAP